MPVLFISDLHLDAARPDAIRQFTNFMRSDARGAAALYILGDLFEAWIGDDEDDPALMPVLDAIRACTDSGVPVYFMHGNRDFLVGDGFVDKTGAELLDEYAVVDLYGQQALLTHGDLLCTDDVRYLQLRAELRDPRWQADFLGKTLAERRRIAAELRSLSRSETAGKDEIIMDVNQAAVEAAIRRFDVRILVHGHTHRPGSHQFNLDGRPVRRIVLADWYDSGSVLSWTESGSQVQSLS